MYEDELLRDEVDVKYVRIDKTQLNGLKFVICFNEISIMRRNRSW